MAAARTVNTFMLSKKKAFLFLLLIPFEFICVVLSDVSSFGSKVVFGAGNAVLIIVWTVLLFVVYSLRLPRRGGPFIPKLQGQFA